MPALDIFSGSAFSMVSLTDAINKMPYQARGSFEYSSIVFEEYRGRVGSVDFTDASKAYFFPVGVPGLFRQYNAPADFVETANTIGLPRYAKQAVDQQFARWVMLHVQSNPLPICTRPRVLIKAKRT
jgi:Phage major capsid protein E